MTPNFTRKKNADIMARSQKTSFNICSVKTSKYGSAYTHQKPEHRATLNYIHSERTEMNENWHKEYQSNGHPKTLRNYLADTKRIVKEKTGRAMQKKAEDNVIAEAVVVIDEQTTMEDLQKLGKAMEQRYGWTCVQIHIHRDEGYLGERTEEMKHREGKYNLHAHMFFVTTNLATGKSWKRQRGEGSVMQDITAQTLNLTRGVKKSEQTKEVKETLNVIEYKTQVEAERLQTLKEQTAHEEQARELAQAKATQVEQKASEQIIAENKMLWGKATDWKKAFQASEERRERLSAQLIENDRQMTEYGLKGTFKSFWEDCKRWWQGVALEYIQSFARLVWYDGGAKDGEHTYTADKGKGRLLIDGQTIEQATAPQIIVPSSPVQKKAQAVEERNAGQSRDTDRHREQHQEQERRERGDAQSFRPPMRYARECRGKKNLGERASASGAKPPIFWSKITRKTTPKRG